SRNPPLALGLSEAQCVSVGLALSGALLLFVRVNPRHSSSLARRVSVSGARKSVTNVASRDTPL
ncbi:MAG: hypothetical protein ABI142_08935, partial [Bryocella sp.]